MSTLIDGDLNFSATSPASATKPQVTIPVFQPSTSIITLPFDYFQRISIDLTTLRDDLLKVSLIALPNDLTT